MQKLDMPWNILAHPMLVVFVGLLLVVILFFTRESSTDRLSARGTVVKIFTLGMATYCFGVCFLSQVIFDGAPSITEIIKLGFGEERTAYMLMGYVLLGFFDLMYIFFPGTKRG